VSNQKVGEWVLFCIPGIQKRGTALGNNDSSIQTEWEEKTREYFRGGGVDPGKLQQTTKAGT